MQHRKIIGQNIRRLRRAKQWSQERLSDKSGVDQGYIGRLERGQMNVSVDTLIMLARALGARLSEIMQGAE
jgi:transcriptional regulator with XRE-family HTH domain